jgi:hypothetical protein
LHSLAFFFKTRAREDDRNVQLVQGDKLVVDFGLTLFTLGKWEASRLCNLVQTGKREAVTFKKQGRHDEKGQVLGQFAMTKRGEKWQAHWGKVLRGQHQREMAGHLSASL